MFLRVGENDQTLNIISDVRNKLDSYDVKVLDTFKDMYVGVGSTLFHTKYVDFLSDAKLIKSVIEYLYYKHSKRYKVYIIDKRFSSR